MPNRQSTSGALQDAIAHLANGMDDDQITLEDYIRLAEFLGETRPVLTVAVRAGWVRPR